LPFNREKTAHANKHNVRTRGRVVPMHKYRTRALMQMPTQKKTDQILRMKSVQRARTKSVAKRTKMGFVCFRYCCHVLT
jgi:hypothetical protein